MVFLYAALLTLLNLFWLFLVILGLPGTWLMVLSAALLAWLLPGQGLAMFSLGTLIAVTVLALLGELFEFLFSAAGSRQSGGSWLGAMGSVAGAIVGGIVGTFVFPVPVVGSLIGACGGAFAGALLVELQRGEAFGFALRSGRGAAVGRFWGTVSKLVVGVMIWLALAVAAFWP